jgi:hypothetical protein
VKKGRGKKRRKGVGGAHGAAAVAWEREARLGGKGRALMAPVGLRFRVRVFFFFLFHF